MLAISGSIYELVSAWNREIWKLFCCFDSVVEKLSDIWDYIRILCFVFCFVLFCCVCLGAFFQSDVPCRI